MMMMMMLTMYSPAITLITLSCPLQSQSVAVSAFSPCRRFCNSQRYPHHMRHRQRLLLCSTKSNDDISITSTTFTATPITINPITQPPTDISKRATAKSDKVNSATLQFNNRLNRMAKNFDATTAPKVEAMLLEAVKNYQDYREDDDQIIAPNTVSFTNAITAWARCTRKDAAKRAQSLLDQMHSLYKEKGWEHVKPNKISYNSVITAWARSRERGSALRAEELLREMYKFYNEEGGDAEDLKPDSRSWNAVINAVARSRDEDCADRAKFLLDEMGRLYDEGDSDLLPDALTFGAIINAYANSFEEGASDKAAQLLLHSESLYQMGFENAKPTTFVCE